MYPNSGKQLRLAGPSVILGGFEPGLGSGGAAESLAGRLCMLGAE